MKSTYSTKIVLLVSILFVATNSFSQQTIANTIDFTVYNYGLNLYNNQAYAIAQKKFKKILEKASIGSHLNSNAAYYEAMCSIKLQQPSATKKMLSYIEENPNSNKKNSALFNLGKHYFKNKKTTNAFKWFQKVTISELLMKTKMSWPLKWAIVY